VWPGWFVEPPPSWDGGDQLSTECSKPPRRDKRFAKNVGVSTRKIVAQKRAGGPKCGEPSRKLVDWRNCCDNNFAAKNCYTRGTSLGDPQWGTPNKKKRWTRLTVRVQQCHMKNMRPEIRWKGLLPPGKFVGPEIGKTPQIVGMESFKPPGVGKKSPRPKKCRAVKIQVAPGPKGPTGFIKRKGQNTQSKPKLGKWPGRERIQTGQTCNAQRKTFKGNVTP